MVDRVLKFRTDGDGRIPERIRLQRDTDYEANPKIRQAVMEPAALDRVISSLEAALLGDVRTLRAGVQIYLNDESRRASDRLGGGNFLLAAACFMLWEYAARIYNGDDSALENFKAYALRFLDFEPKYAQLADLLWRTFRNGIVHGAWPQAICQDGFEDQLIRVGVGVESDDPHLGPDPRVPGLTFVVNAVQLTNDLETSIAEGLVPWLRDASPEERCRAAPRLLLLREHDAAWAQFEQIMEWNGRQTPG